MKIAVSELHKHLRSEVKKHGSIRRCAAALASKYSLELTSLERTYYRSLQVKPKGHGNQQLTDIQEKKVLAYILAINRKGQRLRTITVRTRI